MRSQLPTLVLFALAAPTLAGQPVPNKGELEFEQFVLEPPGTIEFTHFEDIDEDGLHDILAVYALEGADEPARNLVLHFQRPEGFLVEPDISLRVPDEVALIDIGQVRTDVPGKELLLLTGGALHWMAIPAPGDGPIGAAPGEVLIEIDSIFARSERLHLSKRGLAHGEEEAERDMLIIPRTTGYRVYYPDDDYAEAVDFAAEHDHRVSAGSYSVGTAELHLADFDGDGDEDLGFTHLDNIRVYLREEARFSTEPALDLHMQLLTSVDREANMDISDLVGFSVDDFDGDGMADLFVRKTVVNKKAVIHDKQQYQLFINRGARFDSIPDQAFVLKSFDAPEVLDLDGDDRLDIVTGYFEFSLGNIVKALISKRLSIDLSFFLNDEEKGFPDSPNEKRSIKFHISLSNMDENFAPAVEMEGDYDGDGRLDFLMQTGDDKVEIFRGVDGDRIFEKDAENELELLACNDGFVDDLNGDGRSDVIFFRYPDREPFKRNWIRVVLSR